MKRVVLSILGGACLFMAGSIANAENLATNGDFSAGNTGFISQMIYMVSPQPPGEPLLEGRYSVTPNPYEVHKGATSFSDHTTGDGLMLVANGSTTSQVVWSQEMAVVPGEDYVLNFWAATWSAFSPGSLLVFINGVQAEGVFSLPSTPGQWVEFTHNWPSGSATNATVVIKNFTTFSIGNDFAIDDISLNGPRPPPATHFVDISIHDAIELSWPTEAGYTYQLQWTDDPLTTPWGDVDAPVVGDGNTYYVLKSIRTQPVGFYRLKDMALAVDMGHAVELSWPTLDGLDSQLQWSNDLSTGPWNDVDAPVLGDGNPYYVLKSARTKPICFYRLGVTP